MANKDRLEIIPWVIPDRETDLIKLTIQDTGDQGDHGKRYLHYKPLTTTDINQLLYHVTSFYSMIEDLDLQNTDKAFDAFKRTLGPTLKTTWASVYDDIAKGTELDLIQLRLSLENFIRKFYTEKTHKKILDQLRTARKPRVLTVQAFADRFSELNQWASWLQGHEANPILTEAQEKQGLHDSMPQVWCTKYSEMHGNLNVDMRAEIIEYFHECEEDSATREEQNWCKQATEKRKHAPSDNHSHKKGRSFSKGPTKPSPDDSKDYGNADPDKQCPKHPHHDHKWKDCFQNPKNPNSWAAKKAKKAKAKQPASNDAMNIELTEDTAPTADDATIEHLKQLLPSDVEGKQSCDCECCTFNVEHHLNKLQFQNSAIPQNNSATTVDTRCALFASKTTSTPMTSTSTSPRSIPAWLPSTEHRSPLSASCTSTSRWLDLKINTELDVQSINISFDIFNNLELDEFDKIVSNMPSNGINLNALQLKPISLMIVDTIQGHKSRLPLKVLFDTGSDVTLINRKALPHGCLPKKESNIPINMVHGNSPLTQMVELQKFCLPEFSNSLHVMMPHSALVFDNPNSSHDIIMGLDLLHPLGIDPSPSTQTV